MVTVPRWFESSMAHEAAVHHFLFWSFARYRFQKSAKCFFGTMGKNFEMILKSLFSVWLWKDDYYKSTSWHLCGPRLDRCLQNPDTIIVPENCKYSARGKTNSDQSHHHLWLKYQIMEPLADLWVAGVRGTTLSSPDRQSHVHGSPEFKLKWLT